MFIFTNLVAVLILLVLDFRYATTIEEGERILWKGEEWNQRYDPYPGSEDKANDCGNIRFYSKTEKLTK